MPVPVPVTDEDSEVRALCDERERLLGSGIATDIAELKQQVAHLELALQQQRRANRAVEEELWRLGGEPQSCHSCRAPRAAELVAAEMFRQCPGVSQSARAAADRAQARMVP